MRAPSYSARVVRVATSLLLGSQMGICDLGAQDNRVPAAAQVLARIDSDDENLSALTHIAVSRSEVLAVWLWQDGVVRFFNASGEALGTVGRKGEGPGEFRRVEAIGWVGDTLWVSDLSLRRVTQYRADGTLLRMVPIPMPLVQATRDASPIRYSVSSLRALFPDGSMMFHAFQLRQPSSGAPRDVMPGGQHAVRAAPNGDVQFLLATDPPSPCQIADDRGITALAICPRMMSAAAPDGSRHISVATTISNDGVGSLRVISLNGRGDTIFDQVHRVELIPVSAATRDTILRDIAAAARAKAIEYSQYYPPVTEVRVSATGVVWIGRYSPPGQLREWMILDPQGKRLPSVWLPRSATSLTIGTRGAWAVTEAEDGSQDLVLFAARP